MQILKILWFAKLLTSCTYTCTRQTRYTYAIVEALGSDELALLHPQFTPAPSVNASAREYLDITILDTYNNLQKTVFSEVSHIRLMRDCEGSLPVFSGYRCRSQQLYHHRLTPILPLAY